MCQGCQCTPAVGPWYELRRQLNPAKEGLERVNSAFFDDSPRTLPSCGGALFLLAAATLADVWGATGSLRYVLTDRTG